MNVGVIGASGYVGGELLRILLSHPKVEVVAATSNRFKGRYVHQVHPNLRGLANLRFLPHESNEVTEKCDLLFIATPHGVSSGIVPKYLELGLRIVDTSADFRLKNPEDYKVWYGWEHRCPELLEKAVYGLPELHREEIKKADFVAAPGCIAASAILALAPVVKEGLIQTDKVIVDAKVGSSGSGSKPTLATHHAERYGVIRPYKPVGHRHTGEIEQELSRLAGKPVRVSMSAHAVNIVRGILTTCHVFLTREVKVSDVYRLYRGFYRGEPFIRIVRDLTGIYRYPDPKVVVGSNFCDVGFEVDERNSRLVLLSAIDNLIKGAAGTAVQCMNLMLGFDETEGLKQVGIHPV
ncbi:MAG TPA: N-acetyl-gamma-glutamyl-phosphate reductase [Candidatus Bathyarchaeota archaeon]|nr:N-acetyl-gamma-glutamyl-phosphate reductase [Candidatus Bathyarchaeota archaeon]